MMSKEKVMRCPVCKSHEHLAFELQSTGFAENIVECRICGTIWSVNHGMVEVVKDVQKKSFLEATTECVEGDDYYLVA